MSRQSLITVRPCEWRVDGLCSYGIIERMCGAKGEIVLPEGVTRRGRGPTIRELLAFRPKTSALVKKDPDCDALDGKPCRHGMPPATPRYDRLLRTFFLGPFPLRHFERSARSQVGVLQSFQDAGWPPRVEFPLGVLSDLDPQHKLNDAVFDLNHGQVLFLVRFFCDGTGEGVCWELVK